MIPIYEPYLTPYKKSALQAIESGWISNHGVFVEKATQKLKDILNVKHVILMSNGTVATHCLFKSLKFKHPLLTKIYVPNNVYVAAWNAALMEYDEKFLEVLPIDEKTWNMKEDEEFILSLEENAALLVVHNLGNIVNVPRIKSLRPDLIIVEDNCEGIFGKYGNNYSGCSEKTLCSAVSFYGNKTVTTGEGGAFLTNDDEVYNYIKKVYSQGMSSKRYVHDVHAYNYRMTNIQAGFLYDQLLDIDAILQRKKNVFDTYDELLENLKNENKIKLQKVSNNTNRANWMYPLRIVNNTKTPEETFEIFKNMGVETRPFFYSFEHHEHLKNLKCNSQLDSNLSNLLNREIIMIPSSPTITKEEQFKVVESIFQFITFLNT